MLVYNIYKWLYYTEVLVIIEGGRDFNNNVARFKNHTYNTSFFAAKHQKTWGIETMVVWCWANVEDYVPRLL